MPPDPTDPHPRIGAALKEERERQGLEFAALEERTKIRSRYLRALEEEDWGVLPGPAYVRGFLRTYADALGLDPEAIVDEYREEFESLESPSYGVPEAVLTEHRPLDARAGRFQLNRRVVVGALVGGLAILLLILGLTGGGDDDGDGRRGAAERGAKGEQAKPGGDGRGGAEDDVEPQEEVPETVVLKLVPRSDSEICLVNKVGAVLVDNQVLAPGNEEEFEGESFDLSVGFGDLVLVLNGEEQRVKADPDAPVTYKVTPKGLQQPVPDANPECP